MTDNITSISDPSVSFKATKKLRSFFKENKKEILTFKEPLPENILALESEDDILLKVSDLEWLNSFLKHRRQDNFERLTGAELAKEISALLKDEKAFCGLKVSEDKSENVYLHELLDKSEFLLPKNEVIKRNPVLAARVERLRKEQEEREYKAMTRNIDSTKKFMKEDTLAYQMNMMNRHLIAVGQFVLSVGAGFAFGFLGIEIIVEGLDFGFRLLLGIACALVIALAEFYFLAKHLNDEDSPPPIPPRQRIFKLNTSEGEKIHKE